jgi:type I restriction-modification system DNA methylase subunit
LEPQHSHDIELGYADIQALSDADGVAALFSRLGYDTNARTVQSPGNLGITAETLLRRIKKIELIADDEGFFQVYLFQLVSVTVADARALATIFRSRAGNFLLVLTANFDRLDFVFVERIPADAQASTIGTPQPKVRPRTVSVERLKPERVQLRVLRRFTWTEADPFAQYEKLLAAYSVAYWSEDHFNNRALFSDYFLKERLPNSPVDFPEWTEDPKPAYKRLHDIYASALSGLTGKTKESLLSGLLEPVLSELGFKIKAGAKTPDPAEPDYRLYASNGDEPLALCLAYPWDRFLDGKDDKRDAETPDHNPGQRVVSLLEKAEAPWIVVTNGRLWRLYSPRAQSRASNYYEIELDEASGQIALHPSGPAEGFRYFWLLFRRQSFERISSGGEAKPRSLLDRLFDGSQQYAAELGESLKERVFEQIFRLLAEGFVANIRDREEQTNALSQERLDSIFQGVLTLLYRLLFLLYAEARDLLPVRETLEYSGVSITAIKREIGDAAGPLLDAVPGKLKKHYRSDSHALYDRLSRLFGVIDRGDADLNVPAYNGGLFISKPRADDENAEAAAARFLAEHKVPDLFFAQALDLLARDEDPKSHQLVAIDFKSLGVRQLGSIYEGLLEFRLRIAEEKNAIVKEKGREIYVSFKDLDERERERAESQERIVKKGEVYLENDKGERKTSGSYYTPDHIVNYIVEQAVGPVVHEKFNAMRQRLREAERWHRDSVQAARAKGEKPAKYETGPAVENRWRELVNELFDLKILDPAMGSGHFLVETVDYITDKALDFLNSFPWNPVAAHLEMVRGTILEEMDEQGITIDHRRLTDVNLLKRHVLKRCIYGVDLNPMAVELAKVSLWLHCFTLGAPLSFLDHHLRCGNSLIGVTAAEVEKALHGGPSGQTRLFGSHFAGLLLATELMRHVGELSDVTTAQVDESKSEYQKASQSLVSFKRLLDIYTSQWFHRPSVKRGAKGKQAVESREIAFLGSGRADTVARRRDEELKKTISALTREEREIVEQSSLLSKNRFFFHWDLEFPEVFYGPRRGTEHTVERLEEGGFDAVIGNPPYVRQETLKEDKRYFASQFADTFDATNDLYVFFLHREIQLLRPGRLAGLIVANKWLRVEYGRKLRSFLLRVARPISIVDFGHAPIFPDADTFPCVPILAKRLQILTALDKVPENEQVEVCDFPRDEYSPDLPIGPYIASKRLAIPTRFLSEREWSLEPPAAHALLERLRATGTMLRDLGAKPYRGTVSGLNEAFYIDRATMQQLIKDDSSAQEIIKPLLRGRDIDRWQPRHSEMYAIVARHGINIDRYPSIRSHLARFRGLLESKPETWTSEDGQWLGRKPGTYQWYELQDNPYEELVRICDQPKIVYQDIQFHCRFALDLDRSYPDATAYILPSSDEGLLAVLNSPLMWWVLTRILPHAKDEALRARAYIMEEVRVLLPEGKLRTCIVGSVSRLLTVTDERHRLEELTVSRIKELTQSEEIDRRSLLWLHHLDDKFLRMIQKTTKKVLSSSLSSELQKMQTSTNAGFERLLTLQLNEERDLAGLVEDAYSLTPEERKLLHTTEPLRDPIKVLEATRAGRYELFDRTVEENVNR